MPTLFVLQPATADLERLLANRDGTGAMTVRSYPPATDTRHLLGLVRAGRDPRATSWRRGAVLAVAGGALLGTIVNGVLATSFGMFAGLLGLALPLGFGLGAFLGGFTAAMTGTETARHELRELAQQVRQGDRLVQIAIDDAAAARALHERCGELGWPAALVA